MNVKIYELEYPWENVQLEWRSWGLDTTVEKKLKGLEDIGHQGAGNAWLSNFDQGTKRKDEVILCV
jgi:hypothetical protein